jgi:DNA-binding CsgD family transcriptional regulator/PAS domain-containing protein
MRHSAVEHLLRVLYEGGLGERGLEPFLTEVGRLMNAHLVVLQGHDLEHRLGRLDVSVGIPIDSIKQYEPLAGEHPWFIRGGHILRDEGIADDEGLTTDAELRSTRFYNQVLRHIEVNHGLALCLNQGLDGQLSVLSINRNYRHGFYTPEERAVAKALLPHVRNIYQLHQRLSWLDDEVRSFRAALDHLNEGVFLLARNGTVLFANERAQAIEAAGVFLRRRLQNIHCVWPADEQPWREALSKVLAIPPGGGLSLGLHDRNGRFAGSLKLCPMQRMTTQLWSEFNVAVIVFVRPLEATHKPAAAALRASLRFTVAEARLAVVLMEGASLDQAAARLGVSRNTVRTQLRSLFGKTETHRQSELIRVLVQLE